MIPPLAHVAGLPLEETLPTIAPVACLLAAVARARLRTSRRRRPPPRPDRPPTAWR